MRVQPDLERELAQLQRGRRYVAGIDEAGRGALAGPVVAAAVVLPLNRTDLASVLSEVRDSKQLSPAARDRCDQQVRELAVAVGIGEASAAEVDERGLLPATRAAMRRAVAALDPPPSCLLIDHINLPELTLPQEAITRGDQSVLSIAAASVVAKVWRDRLMVELDKHFSGYGFARHKGYGTSQHRQALARLGPCPEHRRSYAPVRRAQVLVNDS
ncbi:MAG: ribonuclease HII [Chloroflexi bacterium]|nr:ribonuclease HII [Chloroflexota bacterium]